MTDIFGQHLRRRPAVVLCVTHWTKCRTATPRATMTGEHGVLRVLSRHSLTGREPVPGCKNTVNTQVPPMIVTIVMGDGRSSNSSLLRCRIPFVLHATKHDLLAFMPPHYFLDPSRSCRTNKRRSCMQAAAVSRFWVARAPGGRPRRRKSVSTIHANRLRSSQCACSVV